MKKKIVIVLTLTILFAFAIYISHEFLYKNLVMPQLYKWHHIPLFWWLLLAIPPLMILIYTGIKLISYKEIPLFSVPYALTFQYYLYLASVYREPGFLKSSEHPLFWKPLTFISSIFIFSLILYLTWILKKFLLRSRKK